MAFCIKKILLNETILERKNSLYNYFHNSENVDESDFVISVEPFGMIDPVKMYETSRLTFSIRHKECLYQGINCKTSKPLGDVKVHFRFANEESWALEVCFLLYRTIFSDQNFYYNSLLKYCVCNQMIFTVTQFICGFFKRRHSSG